ncbi:enoyl-CoA hydratase/isomerase family protein [Pseudonocardia xishanensis]|uniref:enoyl-CoA hydratase/isomerase family protein n=1 Tax=Pseudonocardia xishanensis TaxID=630995 RepID=UPI0031EEE09F
MNELDSTRFETLRVRTDGVRATVTLDNPPTNLFDPQMIDDVSRLLGILRADPETRVVVFDSADPDFFIGHADLNLFLAPRTEVPPRPHVLNGLQALFEDLRTLPQATIGVLEGRAVGGGAEFLSSLDMVFAARGRAVLSQFEAAVGVIPGATGSQRLPRMLGRQRALEVILGCDEFDADTAAAYGLVNRALPAEELRGFVDRLAARIASFPAKTIAINKAAVDAATPPYFDGLLEETHALDQTLVDGEAQRRMKALLALGAQDREFELTRFSTALEELDR